MFMTDSNTYQEGAKERDAILMQKAEEFLSQIFLIPENELAEARLQ